MKFKNFCGIFATLFVTTTIILLASCSQDDDYYENSEMYTLAEMGTRLGGNGGDPGGGGIVIKVYDLTSDVGEKQLHFFQQGTLHQTCLNLHLYALADSAFTQWGACATSKDNNVKVTSATAEYVDSDSINIHLRLNIEILYQKKYWTNTNTYSCPRASFLGSTSN